MEFSLTYKIHTKQIQTNTYIHVHIRNFHIVCYVEIWKKNHHLYSNTTTANGNDTNIIPAVVYGLYTYIKEEHTFTKIVHENICDFLRSLMMKDGGEKLNSLKLFFLFYFLFIIYHLQIRLSLPNLTPFTSHHPTHNPLVPSFKSNFAPHLLSSLHVRNVCFLIHFHFKLYFHFHHIHIFLLVCVACLVFVESVLEGKTLLRI